LGRHPTKSPSRTRTQEPQRPAGPLSVVEAEKQLAQARRDLERWEDHRTFLLFGGENRSDVWARDLRQKPGDDVVFAILREVGLGVLWPKAKDDGPEFAEVQTLMWGRIRDWYRRARQGETLADQGRAAAALRKLGATLAGDRRGKKRRHAPNPVAVWYAHDGHMRRLKTAARELTAPFGVRFETWRARVATECGVPEHVLAWLAASGARATLKQVAIAWTAEHFGLSEGRVATILSQVRSRKRKLFAR